MNTLGPIKHTGRGFELIEFNGRGQSKLCTLQQSSFTAPLAKPGSSAIWLGRGDERMHLDREQVAALVTHLSAWLATGSFSPPQSTDPATRQSDAPAAQTALRSSRVPA
jgi:hypothetical protein